MKAYGKIDDIHRKLDGTIVVSFCMEDFDEDAAKELSESDLLEISITKRKKKRSLDANAYFWVLCDKIAKRLGSDKWAVYLLQLSKYGVFTDVAVYTEALGILKANFRYVEILDSGEMNGRNSVMVRCYIGSSNYDSGQMRDLINGTVEDAKQLGIEILPPHEIETMLNNWKGGIYDF